MVQDVVTTTNILCHHKRCDVKVVHFELKKGRNISNGPSSLTFWSCEVFTPFLNES